jgi:hypothetical protein
LSAQASPTSGAEGMWSSDPFERWQSSCYHK